MKLLPLVKTFILEQIYDSNVNLKEGTSQPGETKIFISYVASLHCILKEDVKFTYQELMKYQTVQRLISCMQVPKIPQMFTIQCLRMLQMCW